MTKKIVSLILVTALIVSGAQTIPSQSVEAKGADTGWNLVWSDEFEGTSLNQSVWNYDIGTGDWGWGNGEIQYYTNKSDNISVSDGMLKITAKKESYNGSSYTSGRINSMGKKAFKYGKMEARIRVEGGNQNGVWPAFWMMGNNMATGTNWPYCGELDIMEHANGRNYVEGTLHWNTGGPNATYNHVFWGSYSNGNYYYFSDNTNNGITAWHTYGVIWDEQKIQWYVDDNIYLTAYITDDNAYAFQKEQFFLLNLALGGTGTGYTGNTTVDSNFSSATMYVDYVRAYQGGSTSEIQTTAANDGMTATSSDKTNLGGWGYYFIGENSGRYSGGASLSDPFTLKVTNNNKYLWNIQAFTKEIDVTAGHTYQCSVKVYSDATSGSILMKDEISGTDLMTKGLAVGDNVFEGTCVASDSGKLQLMFNLGEVNAGTTLKFSDVKITDTTSGETQTTVKQTTSNQTQTTNSGSTGDPIFPVGLLLSSEEDNTITVVWGQSQEMIALGQVYNIYIDDKKVASEVVCGSNTFTNISAGKHTVGVTAVLGGKETDKLTGEITVSGQDVTQQTTTAKPAQTTAKPAQTTAKPVESTTEKPVQTTAKPVQTTAKPTQATVKPTQKVTVKRTSVNRADKKKTEKKVKITLKKIKGATAYQVKVSTKKNFKNGKKITVSKTVKKAKFTIKIKKLAKAKKYYVKARAIKMLNGKKIYGKWSASKKVKIK